MATRTNKPNEKRNSLHKVIIWIGASLIVLSPIVYIFLPRQEFFYNLVCGNGCGYANLGINGYALYAGLAPLSLGVILVSLGLLLRFRR